MADKNDRRAGIEKPVAISQQGSATWHVFLMWSMVFLGLILVVLSIRPYWLRFPVFPSGVSSEWGDFGSYVSGLPNLIISTLNLIAVAYIAINVAKATESRQRDVERAERLFELDREWNGILYADRSAAETLLKTRPLISLDDIHLNHPEGGDALWRVFGFFKSVQMSIENGIVSSDEAVSMFGQVFIWWWIVATNGNGYPKKWDSFERTNKLHAIVQSSKIASEYYEDWIKNAQEERARLRPSPAKTPPIQEN